ncbi:MAG: hypothetical protein SGARI_000222 [Bacillariaceae sp.]
MINGARCELNLLDTESLRSFAVNTGIKVLNEKTGRWNSAGRGIKKPQIIQAINAAKERFDKKEDQPWQKEVVDKKKNAEPTVNLLRLGNVFYSKGFEESVGKRGEGLKKNQLIASKDPSKAGDQPFFEQARILYNSHGDEDIDDLHHDIPMPRQNWPDNFVEIEDWRLIKTKYKKCTMELEKIQMAEKRSGTNDSDAEEGADDCLNLPDKMAPYLQYWKAFADKDPERFKSFNEELGEDIFNLSGKSGKKAMGKKTTTKADIDKQMVEALQKSNKNTEKMLEEQKQHHQALQGIAKQEQLTSLRAERKQRKEDLRRLTSAAIDTMEGANRKEKKKNYKKEIAKAKTQWQANAASEAAGGSQDTIESVDSTFVDILETAQEVVDIERDIKRMSNESDSNNTPNNNTGN